MNQNSLAEISDDVQSLRKIAQAVYLLQSIGIFFGGIPFIIAVVVNHVKRSDARGTWFESHMLWQMRTFWHGLLWTLLGLPIAALASLIILPFLGWFVFFIMALAVFCWLIYRIVRGWLRLTEDKPMYVQT